MFRKLKLLKKLCTFASFTKPKAMLNSFPLVSHQYTLHVLNLPKIYSFSTSPSQDEISRYKDYLSHIKSLPSEERSKMNDALDKYATHKEDLSNLTSGEIKWLLASLSSLYLNHMQEGFRALSFSYLSETDEIFQKLGIKDTIDVALNYYDMSSNLISQERFEEAEKYLNEVSRICQLLREEPQAKSLTVQSWHLLAQINSQSDQDKALELEHAVLQNIGDVSESALPVILPSVYQEMGKIYRSREDIEKMIKSYENALQAVIRYFGENSPVDFNFLTDLSENPAFQNEPSTENRIKAALKPFSHPHMKVGLICCLIGNIYLTKEKYPEAVESFHEAAKIFEKLPQDCSSLLYDVYFSMAKAIQADTHSKARDQYHHRYREYPDFLNKAEQALIKANPEPNLTLAAVYEKWAKHLEGFDIFAVLSISQSYSSRAAEIYKSLDPLKNRAKIFSNYLKLGRIGMFCSYVELNQDETTNWDAILETWKEAEKFLDPTDHPSVQEVYQNLDFIYCGLENYEESEKCVQKILQSCEATGDTSYVFNAYCQNGEYYENFESGDKLEEALKCYKTAARVYEKETNKDPAKAQNLAAKISQIKEKLQKAK